MVGEKYGSEGPKRKNDHSMVHATSMYHQSFDPVLPYDLAEDEVSAIESLPPGSALLVAHAGPGKGTRFLLDRPVMSAGRQVESNIFLDDVTVSRRHAEFQREGQTYRVKDLGSLNGTYVNGDRVDSVLLTPGKEVRIGKFRFIYYCRSGVH